MPTIRLSSTISTTMASPKCRAFISSAYEHAGRRYETTGMMFNVADRFVKGKTTMDFDDNLMSEIEKGKMNKDKHYDPKFWKNLEIVKRTPVENEVVELFERDNLFGVF